MTIQKEVAPDMVWLTKGEEDPHKDYQTRLRAELPMADFSDDQLANYAFMHYDRPSDQEVAMMMAAHRGIELSEKFYSKIAIMTAVKERIRWLSRQVAISEGRIPGVVSANNQLSQLSAACAEKKATLEIWHDHVKGGWESNWIEGVWELNALVAKLTSEVAGTDQEDILGATDTAPSTPTMIDAEPIWDKLCNLYATDGINTLCAIAKQLLPHDYVDAKIKAMVEVAAQLIYETWAGQEGYKPWEVGGNSDKQCEARVLARKDLETPNRGQGIA